MSYRPAMISTSSYSPYSCIVLLSFYRLQATYVGALHAVNDVCDLELLLATLGGVFEP